MFDHSPAMFSHKQDVLLRYDLDLFFFPNVPWRARTLQKSKRIEPEDQKTKSFVLLEMDSWENQPNKLRAEENFKFNHTFIL